MEMLHTAVTQTSVPGSPHGGAGLSRHANRRLQAGMHRLAQGGIMVQQAYEHACPGHHVAIDRVGVETDGPAPARDNAGTRQVCKVCEYACLHHCVASLGHGMAASRLAHAILW